MEKNKANEYKYALKKRELIKIIIKIDSPPLGDRGMANLINIKELFTPNISNNLVSKTKGDRVIWGIVVILTLVSLLVVYSSTSSLAYKYSKSNESYLFKQFAFIILGLLVIYFAHRVNYTIYARVAKIIFLISIPLLIYTYFFGAKINDGSRWIKLPSST